MVKATGFCLSKPRSQFSSLKKIVHLTEEKKPRAEIFFFTLSQFCGENPQSVNNVTGQKK